MKKLIKAKILFNRIKSINPYIESRNLKWGEVKKNVTRSLVN